MTPPDFSPRAMAITIAAAVLFWIIAMCAGIYTMEAI